MRVAIIDLYNVLPVNTGGDWVRLQLLNSISKKHDVTCFYLMDKAEKEGYCPSDVRFKIKRLTPVVDWTKISTKVKWFNLIGPISKEDDLKDFDCLIYSTPLFGIVLQFSRINKKAPIVLYVHDLEFEHLKENGRKISSIIRPIEMQVFNNSDAVISPSSRDYDMIKKMTNKKRVYYLPPDATASVFSADGDMVVQSKDKFNVLFYGSLDRAHNASALRFIVNELVPVVKEKKLDQKILITVFGSGKPPADVDLAEVNYIGPVANPAQHIRGADLVLVPVRHLTGVKVRILESLACGKRIIAFPEAVEGIPDDLKSNVIIADSPEEYTSQIEAVMASSSSPSISIRTSEVHDDLDDIIREVVANG